MSWFPGRHGCAGCDADTLCPSSCYRQGGHGSGVSARGAIIIEAQVRSVAD